MKTNIDNNIRLYYLTNILLNEATKKFGVYSDPGPNQLVYLAFK